VALLAAETQTTVTSWRRTRVMAHDLVLLAEIIFSCDLGGPMSEHETGCVARILARGRILTTRPFMRAAARVSRLPAHLPSETTLTALSPIVAPFAAACRASDPALRELDFLLTEWGPTQHLELKDLLTTTEGGGWSSISGAVRRPPRCPHWQSSASRGALDLLGGWSLDRAMAVVQAEDK